MNPKVYSFISQNIFKGKLVRISGIAILYKTMFLTGLGLICSIANSCSHGSQQNLELKLPPEPMANLSSGENTLPVGGESQARKRVQLVMEEVTQKDGNTLIFQTARYDNGSSFRTLAGLQVNKDWPLEIVVLDDVIPLVESFDGPEGNLRPDPGPNPQMSRKWTDLRDDQKIEVIKTAQFVSPESLAKNQTLERFCTRDQLMALARVLPPNPVSMEAGAGNSILFADKTSLPYGQIVCLDVSGNIQSN